MNDPEFLYHYTNFEGLKGIIENQSLWLSNRKCVNDTKEFMHSKELIKGCIEEALNDFIKSKGAQRKPCVSKEEFIKKSIEERDYLYETFLKNLGEAYLFCFCTHTIKNQKDGLLSMWRGYGEEGGYVLVFNYEKMNEYIKKMDRYDSNYPAKLILERVAYQEKYGSKTPMSIRKNYNHLKELLENKLLLLHWGLKAKEQDEREGYNALLKLIIFIKHPAFHEENEYRLCLLPISKQYLEKENQQFVLEPKIRKRGSSIVSYIEFPLNKFSFKLEDFVKEIIIGPQSDIETKKEFLKSYLKAQGLTKIKVKTSKIPYLPH